jgi:hypothetical protein
LRYPKKRCCARLTAGMSCLLSGVWLPGPEPGRALLAFLNREFAGLSKPGGKAKGAISSVPKGQHRLGWNSFS